MGQFFGNEKITKLVKSSSTIVSLPAGAKIKNGGQGYTNSSAILCTTSTSGFGGIDTGSIAASTFYYVYAVVQSGVLGLVASTSATSPTGFNNYRKVGAFYTDGSSNIFKAYWYGEINNLTYLADGSTGSTGWNMSPASWIASQSVPGGGRTTFTPAAGIFSVDPYGVASPTQASIGQHVYMESVTATSITVRGSNATPALAAEAGTVNITKVGIDAIQPDWSL